MPALIDALQTEQALPRPHRRAAGPGPTDLRHGRLRGRGRYVDTFDRGHRTSLHLFEHIHGDSRERGPALIDLTQTYERAGLYLDAQELPDHLGVVLEFASTQPTAVAREFLAEMAHILNALFSALQAKGQPLRQRARRRARAAGETAQAVAIAPSPTWTRPGPSRAFDGCATRGQNRPDQPQPIHIVRKARPQSSQESRHDRLDRPFPLRPVSLHLPGRVLHRQLAALLTATSTWKSDSSQLLRTGSLRWASNLFHVGVLFLFFGHFVGMLTPHVLYDYVITAHDKQLLAMVSGGITGLMAFVGVTLLLHRRLTDARIRATSKTSDIALLWIFWVQLALGRSHHPAVGPAPGRLDDDAPGRMGQRIVTFRSGAVEMLAGAGWVFKAHLFLGMTVFLIFPFTRLVHVWSGFGTLAYVLRLSAGARAPERAARPEQNHDVHCKIIAVCAL